MPAGARQSLSARLVSAQRDNFWDPSEGLYGLFHFWTFRHLSALVASGLGGGSLIYANVLMRTACVAIELGFRYLPLNDLLATSDFITIHVPLLASTHHLINADTLARVKPGAILVNTSRGPLVDTAALKEALVSGRLRGAGLDVLEDERTVYHDFGEANVVITPHLGWYTEEARDRIMQITLENVRRWMAGDPINRVA